MNLHEIFLAAQIAAKNNFETLNFIDTKGGLGGQTGTSVENKGITAVYNGDGTYTLNGTASSAFVMVQNTYTGALTATSENYGTDEIKHIPNGKYIATCDPEGRIDIQLGNSDSSNVKSVITLPHNSTITVDDSMQYTWIRLRIIQGAVFNNETIRPMLRQADAVNSDFKQYAPTNCELYKMILDLQKSKTSNSVLKTSSLSYGSESGDTSVVSGEEI